MALALGLLVTNHLSILKLGMHCLFGTRLPGRYMWGGGQWSWGLLLAGVASHAGGCSKRFCGCCQGNRDSGSRAGGIILLSFLKTIHNNQITIGHVGACLRVVEGAGVPDLYLSVPQYVSPFLPRMFAAWGWLAASAVFVGTVDRCNSSVRLKYNDLRFGQGHGMVCLPLRTGCKSFHLWWLNLLQIFSSCFCIITCT